MQQADAVQQQSVTGEEQQQEAEGDEQRENEAQEVHVLLQADPQAEQELLRVRSDYGCKRTWFLMDSGTYAHVAPESFASWQQLRIVPKSMPVVGADGTELQYLGRRTVDLHVRNGLFVNAEFDILKIQRPILSVGALSQQHIGKVWEKSLNPFRGV